MKMPLKCCNSEQLDLFPGLLRKKAKNTNIYLGNYLS